MKDLAKQLGVYNDGIDTGPELWSFVMAAGLVTYGVGTGLAMVGFDKAMVFIAVAFGLFWAALILRK